MSAQKRLCSLNDLPRVGYRGFAPENDDERGILVIRRENRVWVYRDQCPHDGGPLASRAFEHRHSDGDLIVCGGHGACFDVATGYCLSGPCEGRRLRPVSFRLSRDGELYLRGKRRWWWPF